MDSNHNSNKKSTPWKASSILRIIGIVLLAIVVLAGAGLAYLTVTEYKPEDVSSVETEGSAVRTLSKGDRFTIMTWNMGYGALGDNADFFMDGGSAVMTASKERVAENLDGISAEIGRANPDVLFLQEIDEDSKRSYHVNEIERYQGELPGFQSAFAYNYKANYVPYPIPTIGMVQSGIITFSQFEISEATRYQLPISFSWPVSTVNLKRALLVTRIPVEGTDSELVLVNLHLEAYDSGEGKIAQTKQLAELLNEEYHKGNYVIAGGDFNQIFSSEDPDIYPLQEGTWHPGVIDISGIKGIWHFLQDESTPSCRSLDQPYAGADHETFQYYLIDGFIVSGNIDINRFKTQDLDFANSDHNPVIVNVTLK